MAALVSLVGTCWSGMGHKTQICSISSASLMLHTSVYHFYSKRVLDRLSRLSRPSHVHTGHIKCLQFSAGKCSFTRIRMIETTVCLMAPRIHSGMVTSAQMTRITTMVPNGRACVDCSHTHHTWSVANCKKSKHHADAAGNMFKQTVCQEMASVVLITSNPRHKQHHSTSSGKTLNSKSSSKSKHI